MGWREGERMGYGEGEREWRDRVYRNDINGLTVPF
jgi:hypothetical protein